MVAFNFAHIPSAATVASTGSFLPRRSGRFLFTAIRVSAPPVRILVFAFLVCVGIVQFGVDVGGNSATQLACVALLLLGLPHGTFDWQLLKAGLDRSIIAFTGRLFLYVALAAATFAIWKLAPALALSSFLIISVAHFAEDWVDETIEPDNQPVFTGEFLALAVPISLLTIPALTHPETLRSLFAVLTNSVSSGRLVDAMILIAPVATAVAAVKIFTDFTDGQIDRGIAGICVLLAMALLPPIIGFAIYFCFYHSPLHFGAGIKQLKNDGAAKQMLVITGLTLAALAIAGFIFALGPRLSVTDNVVTTAFMTLSMLTVPHMSMPTVIGWLQRRSHHKLQITTGG